MKTVNETGGSRIGRTNATWPFATLKVSAEKLELNTGISGKVAFRPSDVTSIETYNGGLTSGIRIYHNVPSYSDLVVFSTRYNPKDLIKEIKDTGFLSATGPISIDEEAGLRTIQSQGGSPFKKPFKIIAIVLWNILFISDFWKFYKGQTSFPLGIGAQIALGLTVLTGLLLLVSDTMRKMVMKEGRTLDDVKRMVIFIMIVCGLMLIQFRIFTTLFNHK